jgi:nitrite reductase/ring-hydroxylating ferredoxin subunit
MPDWVTIPETRNLDIDASISIILNGTDIALCRDDSGFYALSNRCPHRQGQIGDGRVENGRPIARSTTGTSTSAPASRPTTPTIASAIAMGADAVAIATSALISIGCQQYRACHTGNCPVGIATQRADLRARFDVDTATQMAGNFFEVTRSQLADYCRILGKRDIHTLSLEDLVTTDSEISNHTGVEHA